MKLKKALSDRQNNQQAFLAANFYNMETLFGILRAAQKAFQPVILQTSPSTLNYMGLDVAVQLARAAARQFKVTCWLHLDHCHDLDMIRQCIEVGYLNSSSILYTRICFKRETATK